MSVAKHIRLPLKAEGGFVVDSDLRIVCEVYPREHSNQVDDEALAELIVRAVNCHDEFVQVCQEVLNDLMSADGGLEGSNDYISAGLLRAVLAKAKA